MNESIPNSDVKIVEKDKISTEVNYFYSKWMLENADKNWCELNKNENSLREELFSKVHSLRSKFPSEYEKVNSLHEEKDKLWSNFYNERKRLTEESPKVDPLVIVEMPIVEALYQKYKIKRDEYDESCYIIHELESNFPDEEKEIELTREKLLEASNASRILLDKYFLNKEYHSIISKEYTSLESNWYEEMVNFFTLEIDKYKSIKEKKLQKRLTKELGGIRQLTPDNENEIKSLIGKHLLIIEELSNQLKKWVARTTILAFSVLAISSAMKNDNDRITNQKVSLKIDNIYNKAIIQEVDSVTNVILHDIAQDKELPKEWREFLSKEDSSEFYLDVLREEYKNTQTKKKSSVDLDSKIEYIALLRMNEKYGKPKAEYGTARHFHDRACYSIYANTMRLPTYTGHFSLSDYLAELSHAVQYNGAERDKYLSWYHKDHNKTDSIAKEQNINYDDAQLFTYSDKTTLEYEAHSIIEPRLIKEFEEVKEAIKREILVEN